MSHSVKVAFFAVSITWGATAADLKWLDEGHFRSAEALKINAVKPGFTQLTGNESGIRFTNQLSIQKLLPNHNFMNGSGVALGDFDSDGWCDVYLCNLEGANGLYRNLGGWKFSNVTVEAGVACINQASTGAVFADVNGDRKLDLIVTALGGPNSLFINQGGGKFVDTAATAGISSRLGAMSMALGDVDGNGSLDLYIANYGATSILRSGGALNVSYVNGKPVVRGRYAQRIQIIGNTMFELGEPDALYLNDGTGKFKPVSWTDGTFVDEQGIPLKEAPWDQGLAVMFRDVNGDRAPDIYVCNDAFTPDRFWINDGKGKFRAMSRLAWRTTSHSSMGVDFADYDRDGDDDFVVVDMLSRERRYLVTQRGTIPPQPKAPGDLLTQVQVRRNTFYENRGDGTYAEISNLLGLAASEWSWNPVFIDVDLDGWEDLLISNGFPFNMDDMDTKDNVRKLGQLSVEQSRRTLLMYPKLNTPNMAFRNLQGSRFELVNDEWGFNSTEVSNGVALGDLDNDGDQDVVVNTFNGAPLIYRNETPAPRILIKLKGNSPNTQGVGARITVHGGPVVQAQEVISGGRYASGDDPSRMFATGDAKKLRVEVRWRNGAESTIEGVTPNRIYEIDEAHAVPGKVTVTNSIRTLFTDASKLLSQNHHEIEFNDFERQPALPHKLSRPGPGQTWYDIDGNGWEDLLVGNGMGGGLDVAFNEHGKFRINPITITAADDLTAILARRKSEKVVELIVGMSNFETLQTNRLILLEARGTNIVQSGMLSVEAAIGALALTESQGTMLLFAGGKFVPGLYPAPAPSHLFFTREGKWVEDQKARQVLARLGTITGATWADLNNDGNQELLASSDWGAIKIFEYGSGELIDRSESWGTSAWVGRWQSIATGDFDSDGRIDFIAGNWGTNTMYNQAVTGRVELRYGEFTEPRRTDLIECYQDPDGKVVPWRDIVAFEQALPWLSKAFASHNAYSQASVDEVLRNRSEQISAVRIKTLASTLFLNRGGRFEAVPLPREAQFAPVFGISVADFDLDGINDVALSQNFFGTRETDGPLDAGRGLILHGGESGKLTALSGMTSGVIAYGEQRGCAVSDFNQDGRADLSIGQNGSETKVFRNESVNSGIRVKLSGTDLNRDGFGSQMRVDQKAQVVFAAGGGYCSQDSTVKIVPAGTRKLEILWPTGKLHSYEVPPGSTSISLGVDGSLTQSLLPPR